MKNNKEIKEKYKCEECGKIATYRCNTCQCHWCNDCCEGGYECPNTDEHHLTKV